MSTLGLIAVAIAAVVVGLVLLRRGRAAATDRPKTVADLVRLRAESAGSPVPAAVGAGTGGRDAAAAAGPGPAIVLPVMTPPVAAPHVPQPGAPATGGTGSAAAAAAAPGPAGKPEPPTPTVDVPQQARSTESTEESGTGLLPTVDDTPWGRAARMVSGGGEPGAWRAPESVEIVPLRLLSPQTPADRPSGAGSEDWTGWADWADVDAEEDARAEPVQPTPDLPFGVTSAPAGAGSRKETSARQASGSDPTGAGAGSPAAEPAAAEPAAAGDAAAEPAAARPAADPEAARNPVPSVVLPAREPVAHAEPAAAGPAAPEPAAARPAAAQPEAARNPVPPVAGPVAAVAPATEPSASDAAADPTDAAASRSRQSAGERAAEQAATDLALLRTFGYADPSLRPDSAPVVSLISQQDPRPEPVPGAEQPVRFRAVRRGGTPAEGVAVMLLDDRGRTVAEDKAGPDGRGEVLAPAPGGYVLVCTARGHQPGAAAITVADAPIEADVLLVRSASLFGSVHGEDGPIEGARVTLVQDGEIVDAVDTDAEGAYRIGDIAAGEYGLSVVAAGCEPIAVLLELPDEMDLRHDVELEPAGVQAAYDPTDDDEFVIGQL
jgi:hypothetical protein